MTKATGQRVNVDGDMLWGRKICGLIHFIRVELCTWQLLSFDIAPSSTFVEAMNILAFSTEFKFSPLNPENIQVETFIQTYGMCSA